MKNILITALLLASSGTLAQSLGQRAALPTVPDARGKPVNFAASTGQWQVIYFYPEAFTGGCTIEAHEYSSKAAEFAKLNAVVYGVSADSPKKQLEFVTSNKLKITMLPDGGGALGKALGVKRDGTWYDRDTFVLDPQGKLALVRRGVNPVTDAREVLEFIRKAGR